MPVQDLTCWLFPALQFNDRGWDANDNLGEPVLQYLLLQCSSVLLLLMQSAMP